MTAHPRRRHRREDQILVQIDTALQQVKTSAANIFPVSSRTLGMRPIHPHQHQRFADRVSVRDHREQHRGKRITEAG